MGKKVVTKRHLKVRQALVNIVCVMDDEEPQDWDELDSEDKKNMDELTDALIVLWDALSSED